MSLPDVRAPVLLDTNLALLLIVGSTDQAYISRHKRLSGYSAYDYKLLERELLLHASVVLTPNIWTETSNLLRHHAQPQLTEMMGVFAVVAEAARERYVPSSVIVRHRSFDRLGLADAGLLEIAATGLDILTTDLDLYLEALRLGLNARNFAHIIEAANGI